MIDFRSLRDSGITWRFLAGHRESVVQREAGHEHISTTLGYAKEVQDRAGRYGEPFPTLPPSLVGQAVGQSGGGGEDPSRKLVGEAGIETTSLTRRFSRAIVRKPERSTRSPSHGGTGDHGA